jgi:hypothetical protein
VSQLCPDGDGVVDQTVQAGSTLTLTHVFADARNLVVKATALDKDGGLSALASQSVRVLAVSLQPDASFPFLTNLVIGGTTGNDRIHLDRVNGLGVRVTINGVVQGTYYPTGRLLVFGQSGADVVDVSDPLLAAWLRGGKRLFR